MDWEEQKEKTPHTVLILYYVFLNNSMEQAKLSSQDDTCVIFAEQGSELISLIRE